MSGRMKVRYIPKDGDDEIWVEIDYISGVTPIHEAKMQADVLINEVRVNRGKPPIIFNNHHFEEIYEYPTLEFKRKDRVS